MTSTIQNGEGEWLEILAMRCLANHGREAYANPNVIRAMLDFASLAREPATADVERVCLPPDDYDVQLMLKGGMPGCPCCERTATTFSRFFPHSGIYQAYVHCAHCDVQVFKNARDHDEARRVAADTWAKRPALSRAAPSSEPAIAEAVERMRANPFCDDAHMLGTTQQDDRMRHYATISLAQSSTPPANKGVEESPYIAGPIWAEPEDDCFTAEVQVVGGHEVVATVHGGTRDEAEQRQLAVIAALAASPTPSNDTLQGRGE